MDFIISLWGFPDYLRTFTFCTLDQAENTFFVFPFTFHMFLLLDLFFQKKLHNSPAENRAEFTAFAALIVPLSQGDQQSFCCEIMRKLLSYLLHLKPALYLSYADL